MNGQLPLRAIAAFHATARFGSVTQAADELNVTRSAISQQIRFLEAYLGISLFVRDGRGIALSEAGARYYDSIAPAFQNVYETTTLFRGYQTLTVLNVRCSPTFSAKWILPRLASFIDAHPTVELRIDATAEFTGFDRGGVDLDIRYGEGRWPGLYVEPLTQESVRPLCAPSLLGGRGHIEPAELPNFRLIHSVKSLANWQQWFDLAGVRTRRRWQRILFDRSFNAIQAGAAGLGMVLESDVFAHEEIADGRLVCPVREPPRLEFTGHWLVCPHAHLQADKVQSFVTWLKANVPTPERPLDLMRS
ncbi:LysR substrate-binding domain-containing protein [Marinivivus vitaminiproducens]|uniref:LysR substrate-binding domain-containing protein n=1 Tax=Marinivivus vitaminiproducens TaxID=3035935 RepID=UPI0027A22297|nr:LysR substrate-binding domain-containing protein [Geminicoccaceae bacterium SCSIO 64248]